ncbi:methyltransferase domain-containing protein [Geoglobus acetivorans]|uniref:Methyltransferase domain-containing protein n=1 Tax=Geoglobus acetivorans TaxID=565033 RepID=A0A0A7GGV1_GEOAI|nr:hypothetical protein GACE_1133 [Geoglobus acetivorans]
MRRGSNFLGEYLEHYLRDRELDISFEKVLDFMRKTQVVKSLRKYRPRTILEIGPGPDPVFQYLDPDEYDVYGIVEPNDGFVQIIRDIAESKKVLGKIRLYNEYFEDSIKKLKKRYNFQFLIISSVLHEIPDIDKFLYSVLEICNKDTIIHLNVPNAYSFHRVLAYEMGIINSVFELSATDVKFNRQRVFDKDKLVRILDTHGFEVLSIWTYFIKPFSNRQMEELVYRGIVDKSVIKGLARMSKYFPNFGAEIFIEAKPKENRGEDNDSICGS